MEMKIDALAGTLESSDVMVRIGPATQPGIQLEIDSIVKQQFGDAIERVVRETLTQLGVSQANVVVDDVLYVYYGAADQKIGVATAEFPALVAFVMSHATQGS